MQNLITKTVNLKEGTPESKRAEIRDYFLKTWEVDEKLYTQLVDDTAFYLRGDPLRHVILFYLGHTAVFFINKLLLAKIIDARVNPVFESIFAIGVDEMSWDDLDERHYNWPSVSAVRLYREEVKKTVLEVIDRTPLSLPVDWENPFWIILMGIEHERIHLETSSVLIRQLPIDKVVGGRFGKICEERGDAPVNAFLPVPGAEMKLGKPMDHPFYGWDNEYGSRVEQVEDFRATQMLVSNGEYLRFVEDGGYDAEGYWTEEGWNWRNFRQTGMPLFWRKKEHGYALRLVAEEIPMPWNWPVEVNYLEAKAYCNWLSAREGKTYRLPTEAEWYRLAEHCNISDVEGWNAVPGNINLEEYASPCPVDKFKQGDFYDVAGNVWQWTETPITGFAGFRVHPLYDDFSTPTFDGKHNLIKGGSWISTGNEATLHARYAFRRHFYQHAGFRVVESEHPLVIENDEYEMDPEVANSCENNWGDLFGAKLNFHNDLAALALTAVKDRKVTRVLDLNADTGRLAFELAPYFSHITALDFSARFIRMPIQLQEKGFVRYIVKEEDELVLYRELLLAETGLAAGKEPILFMQENANNIKPIYTGYDLIIVPNLLEELINPIAFLEHIHERLNEDGTLILASTYDWETNAIVKENRPGGFKRDGEPVTSLEGIQAILEHHFVLEKPPVDLTCTLRKSARCSEVRLSEVTVWRKKS
ncbi:5-histidylcysteine sulfoxide synthase [uncultured Bacteroides sp.]|uniref:5-histidylcysteine sulfoxide synthase n=1 Tax=uncultured Bacteroides sp. TaxID=162156 RepID=UPI002AA72F8B|nr:5-histidylcysteine sulfoxide synthase [uncultured Bacteroides sp.]